MPRPAQILATVGLATLAGTAGAAVRDPAVPAARLALDAPSPLFGAHNATDLRPGERRSACVSVVNRGDGDGRAVLLIARREGALARHLALSVTRGCEPPGASLFAGRLAEFPAGGLDAGATWRPGERRELGLALVLADDPAAAGQSASWDWRLAVTGATVTPGAPSPARAASCSAVRLPGGRRTLVRRVRVAPRVSAVLVVRLLGSRGRERLVLTTGLRVRGKTLDLRGWADVRYDVNGRGHAGRRRPFRVRVAAGAIRPGTNRIVVAVRPRGGTPRRATFVLRARAAQTGPRSVCEVGS
jgi:hypothetical protein